MLFHLESICNLFFKTFFYDNCSNIYIYQLHAKVKKIINSGLHVKGIMDDG